MLDKEQSDSEGKNVWPIRDYVKPKRHEGEADEEYSKRVAHPVFLGDGYDKPRVVEFYAPWCGHCIHYKPHYISLGKESYHLNPLIDFYAVSCVAHQDICKDNDIRGYPSLKFYAEYNSTGVQVPSSPNANKVNKDFFEKYSKLSVDSNSSSGGDSSSSNSITNTDPVAKTDKKSDSQVIRIDEKRKEHTYDTSQIDLSANKITSLSSSSSSSLNEDVIQPNDIYINAASSLQFALRSSVFMTNDALSKRQAQILKEWLTLLQQTLPSSSSFSSLTSTMKPVMKTSLNQVDSLLSNLDDVVQSEEELLDKLQVVHKQHDKKELGNLGEEQWTRSCSKGNENAGYTCGLWQLFHIITIGLVHYNIEQERVKKPLLLSTMKSADTIRDYIEYYFTCDECRINFIKMYEECRFDRCNRLSSLNSNKNNKYTIDDWKQLALWLWEAHNDVNVRLLREARIGSDLEHVTIEEEDKVKWPSKTDCPKCWHDGGGWNEDIVYQYLDSFYWPMKLNVVATEENTAPIPSYFRFISIFGVMLLLGFIHLRKKRKHKSIKK